MAKHLVLRPFRLGPKKGLENSGETVTVKAGEVVECKSHKDNRGDWKGDTINGVEQTAGFIQRMIQAKKISAEVVEDKKPVEDKKSSPDKKGA